ncbi:unnamed protein product [Rhizophagus irregularis]|nr:unnamed protein product [Rhizophagus irregularis]CAB4390129.1 unnamed protein product [Rhizophagus irregularis]
MTTEKLPQNTNKKRYRGEDIVTNNNQQVTKKYKSSDNSDNKDDGDHKDNGDDKDSGDDKDDGGNKDGGDNKYADADDDKDGDNDKGVDDDADADDDADGDDDKDVDDDKDDDKDDSNSKDNDDISKDDKRKLIDEIMSKFGPNVIDEWLNYLRELKKLRISDVYLNSNTNTVQLVEEKGVLILRLYSDDEKSQKSKYEAHYYKKNNGHYVFIELSDDKGSDKLSDNKGSRKLSNDEGSHEESHKLSNDEGSHEESHKLSNDEGSHEESHKLSNDEGSHKVLNDEGSHELLRKKPKKLSKRLIKKLSNREKNLELLEELSKELNEFEEESSDGEELSIKLGEDLHKILQFVHKLPTCPPTRDKKIFSRSESYRQAIINHLINDSEFLGLRGFCQADDIAKSSILSDIVPQNHTRVSFIIKDEKNIKNVLRQLTGNIFNSVIKSTRSKVAKDILRRQELRFHVEVWKSYVCLQAFCAANLKRNKGETTRSQAKKKIIEEYPDIDFSDLDLILQISPRIYRLLQVSNGNWALLDIFEEITPTFFKSKMKIATNFDLWINLVRTGMLEDYKNGQSYHEREKQELRDLKIQIIKSYFNDVDEEKLNNIIKNDD